MGLVTPISFYTIAQAAEVGPVLSDLLLYVDATQSGSYPGSGSIWYDISGNSNDMLVTGSYQATPGYFDFNAGNNNASVSLTRPTTGTLEIWVRYITVGAGSFPRLSSYGPSDNLEQSIRGAGANYAYYRSSGGGWDTNAANPTFTANVWTQIAITWTSGGSFIIYKDGSFVRSTTHNLVAGGTTFYIANRYLRNEGTNVEISIVRMYSAALTASQILLNYNTDKDKFGL